MAATTASVFRGEGVPAQDRFDYWRELLRRTRASEVTSRHSADFRAEMHRLELGPVTLLRSSFQPARFHRTERMVRRSDQRLYHLTLVLSGGMALDRDTGPTEFFGPGDLHMANSSNPYDIRTFGARTGCPEERRVEAIGIDFPAALLPVPPHRLRDVFGRRVSTREGTGALLSEFLVGLVRQADVLGPAEAPRLGTVMVDLVAAWLTAELDAGAALPDDVRHRALMESVRSFIRHNLHDPALSPALVAAAHHISVSYLHRLFTQHAQGETVAAWIRRQRLEKARHDLTDPALRTMPVHTVGARCGIPRASDFSRAFRAAYGLSPTEHRHLVLSGRTGDQ